MNELGVGVAILRRAVEIYVETVWPEDPLRHVPAQLALTEACDSDQVLSGFRSEHKSGEEMRRYTLRLGNDRYPFMKLVFQELIVKGAFYFAVDTHDDVDVRAGFPDYDQWLDLKRHNTTVKQRIEEAWLIGGVPTIATLVDQVANNLGPAGSEPAHDAPVLLLVDDDPKLLRCLEQVVRGGGYRSRCVGSAEAALALLTGFEPDLILTDLEMFELSGLDLARRVRDDPTLPKAPVVLVTAADVSGRDLDPVDEVVSKPYEKEALLKTIARFVGSADDESRTGEESGT